MAEMIVSCPHCEGAVQLDTQYAGQTVACPHCQGGIIVPAETPAVVEEPAAPEFQPQQEAAPEPTPEPQPEPVSTEAAPEPVAEPETTPEPEASPEPEPTPEQEKAPEPEPTPEPEAAPGPETAADAGDASADQPAPAPKRKQPVLGSKAKKKGATKRMVTRGGKVVTKKKAAVSSAAAGAAATKKPTAEPKPEAAPGQTDAETPELAPGEVPAKAKGWSWAAFLWGPIWAIGNKIWWGLLTLVPLVNIIFIFILAAKGKKQSWEKGKWRDIDHFVKVQKRWVVIWLILFLLNIVGSVVTVLVGGGAALVSLRGLEPVAIPVEDVSFEEPGDISAGSGSAMDAGAEESGEEAPTLDMGTDTVGEDAPSIDLGTE